MVVTIEIPKIIDSCYYVQYKESLISFLFVLSWKYNGLGVQNILCANLQNDCHKLNEPDCAYAIALLENTTAVYKKKKKKSN